MIKKILSDLNLKITVSKNALVLNAEAFPFNKVHEAVNRLFAYKVTGLPEALKGEMSVYIKVLAIEGRPDDWTSEYWNSFSVGDEIGLDGLTAMLKKSRPDLMLAAFGETFYLVHKDSLVFLKPEWKENYK